MLALQRMPWLAGFLGMPSKRAAAGASKSSTKEAASSSSSDPASVAGGGAGDGQPYHAAPPPVATSSAVATNPKACLLGAAVLREAIKNGHDQVLAWMACRAALEHGGVASSPVFAGSKHSHGDTALWAAASAGQPVAMQALVSLGIDPRTPGPKGRTPFAALVAGDGPGCSLPDEHISLCVRYLSLFPHWRAPSVVCAGRKDSVGAPPLVLAADRLGVNTLLALLRLPAVAGQVLQGDKCVALEAVNRRDATARGSLARLCAMSLRIAEPRHKTSVRVSMLEESWRQMAEAGAQLAELGYDKEGAGGGEGGIGDSSADVDAKVLELARAISSSSRFGPPNGRVPPFEDFRPKRPQSAVVHGARRKSDTPFGLNYPHGLRKLLDSAWY